LRFHSLVGSPLNQRAPDTVQRGTNTDTPHTSTLGLISWALYDWANNAFATVIQTCVFVTFFTQQVADNATAGSVGWSNGRKVSSYLPLLTR
jgi:MFS-type transporter involved in bile tolerance (Atg22 family)